MLDAIVSRYHEQEATNRANAVRWLVRQTIARLNRDGEFDNDTLSPYSS
jgi:hypothetical protein